MADPKLNALVFCVKAVFTDPWWNLIGVFQEYYLRTGQQPRLDAYVKIGDAAADTDCELLVAVIDPDTGSVAGDAIVETRAAIDGTVEVAFPVVLQNLREGAYTVEVSLDGRLIDVQKLMVVDLG